MLFPIRYANDDLSNLMSNGNGNSHLYVVVAWLHKKANEHQIWLFKLE